MKHDILQAMETAVAAHRRGRLELAVAGYRQVLRLQPAFPEAHNNLGQALRAIGRPGEAVASYRSALQIRPDYAAAHCNLAVVLAELGDKSTSLRHALRAQALEHGNPLYRRVLAAELRGARFTESSQAVVNAVEACFADPDLDHQVLVQAAHSLLRLRPHFRRALDLAREGNPQRIAEALQGGELAEFFGDRLLRTVMTKALFANPLLERLLTALRCQSLKLATELDAVPAELLYKDQAFAAALACQCFLNEYVYSESAEETARISRLQGALDLVEPDWPSLIVFAMYRPLHVLPGASGLAARNQSLSGPLALFVRQQIEQPLAERQIASAMPRLTPIANGISGGVRQHYEENPYPRWQSIQSQEPQPLCQAVGSLFPHVRFDAPQPGLTRVLVAGCGTGKHAMDVATRYTNVEVLALDLSLPSLAYGQRKADEAGLTNLRFAQGDILALDGLPDRFDLIEALGVLHHLADPLAGWQKLVALLAPAGLMKVGLYSARARAAIIAARGVLRQRGFTSDAQGIRAARQAILKLAPGNLARKAARELDFHSLSGCRDLLFHVQEREYTIGEIAESLDRLGLEFLGFEFDDDEPRRAYTRRFPEAKILTDLSRWDAFEATEPDTFHNMYQFWCRRSG